MKLKNTGAEIFIPDKTRWEDAAGRTTHMGIGAHPDDLEIAAFHGILECHESREKWFFGIIATDGSGSPGGDRYAALKNEDIARIRNREQKEAAVIGRYSAVAMLNYPGSAVRERHNREITEEIKNIISACAPEVIYTHNPADSHETHVAVAVHVIEALRELPGHLRPARLYGCEVWGSLDWLPGRFKVSLDVSANPRLAADLIRAHDSQVSGGKKLDRAAVGRRFANATFAETHAADRAESVICAMDMTPLIKDTSPDINDYLSHILKCFSEEILERCRSFTGN